MTALVDAFGRPLTDLRISLTDRCNFACLYCHNEGLGDVRPPRAPATDEMTADEVVRIVRIAREFDVRAVKFTGGEPLLRNDVEDILARLPPDVETSLTTNGSLLAGRARALKDAGLARVNVSVDSLDPQHFRDVRRGELEPVLRGVDAALAAGLTPVKVNMVVLDRTLDELPDLLDWAGRQDGLVLQLIEVMPEIRTDMAPRRVDVGRLRADLERRAERIDVRPIHARRVYHIGRARVELVDPVGNPDFCAACTRVRVTHRGELKGCLNVLTGYVTTRGLDDDGVRAAFRHVVATRRPFYPQRDILTQAVTSR